MLRIGLLLLNLMDILGFLSNVLYDDKTSMSTQSQTMKLQTQDSEIQNLATRV